MFRLCDRYLNCMTDYGIHLTAPPHWRIGHIFDFAVRSKALSNGMRCSYLFFFIPFTVFALPFPLPPSRNSNPRSHSWLSPPLKGGRIQEISTFCFEGKAQIVQRIWNWVHETAQKGQQHEKERETAPEVGVIPGTAVTRNSKGYNLWAVLSAWRLTASVLCVCWRSTVRSVICPAEKHQKANAYPLARSLSIYARGSLLSPPTLHAFFA